MSENNQCACDPSNLVMLPVRGFGLAVDAGALQGGSDGGAAEVMNYSLEEQDTGRLWLDGKKIYQRTIPCGGLPNAAIKEVPHGIANIQHVVRFYGTSNNGDVFVALPHVGGSDIYTHVDKTNIRLMTKTNCSMYAGTHVTVFYTCSDR